MNNKLPIAIFLMGTTASKKTYLAIRLEKILPIELISVDSSLIYKKMDIGTDKPQKTDLFYAKHWLIDIKEPHQYYSVFEFYNDVLKIMDDITKRGKIPFLVGGSMFYYHQLINTMSPLPSKSIKIRNMIKEKINKKIYKSYYDMLKNVDVFSSKRIHYNDNQRILRALEVFFLTGKTLSELIKIPGKKIPYKIYQFGLTYYDREKLYRTIKKRIFKMLELGFENEVRNLINQKYLQKHFPSMRCIGYKQMFSYISNEINYHEMINQTIIATRHLAKKQLTWLRNWKDIYWLNSDNINKAYSKLIRKIIDFIQT
ncbi:tRNA (adenosine(37)-N6)-dimethylallyltransferase MiaA [Enterobacteriaceae endosymbiont of Donacia tomentosa]|nr:tRNA (adenosine(37)-N6)-dimethylallyltransferase MiaA [Enterobacteriaceae endosymbiont of Donacia tomentosa]